MRYVFVSSTFKDMQFERDEIKNRLTPRIDTFLSSFGENVYFGDLRWGVNTSEMNEEESSKKVLKVCLDEIDDCRPYMIVFIGERYGWIPASTLMEEMMNIKGIKNLNSDISVTNLEIEYGALINPDLEGRILFYFRNLDTSQMDEEEKSIYGSESPLHKEKLELLKNKIKELYPDYVREYDAKYNKETKRIENLSPLMEMVYEDLTRIFKIDLDKFNQLQDYERAINNSHTRFERFYKGAYRRLDLDYTLGTYKEVDDIYQATYEEIPALLAINGENGKGKNTYLACLYEESIKDTNVISIPFVTGLDKYTKGKDELLELIICVFERELSLERDENYYKDDKYLYMSSLLDTYSKKDNKLIRFFIMNVNDEILKVLRYINFSLDLNLRNVSFYIAIEQRNSGSYKNNVDAIPFYPHHKIIYLNEIPKEEKYDLIKTILANKHKELPNSIINKIIKKPSSDYPLYLSLVIERLLILDHEDFDNIRHLGDGMVAIEKYMGDIVENAGEDIKDITRELLKEACQRINPTMIPIILRLLSYDFLLTTPQIGQFFKYENIDYSEIDFSLFVHYIPTLFKESSISASYLEFRTYEIKEMAKEVADQFKVRDYKDDIIAFFDTLDEDEVSKDKSILEACYRFNKSQSFSHYYLLTLKKFHDEVLEGWYEVDINKFLPSLYGDASKKSNPFFVEVAKRMVDTLLDDKITFHPTIISNIIHALHYNFETTELLFFWAYSFVDITTYTYSLYTKNRNSDPLFFFLIIIHDYTFNYFWTAGMRDVFDENYEKLPLLDKFEEEFDNYDEERKERIYQNYVENGLHYDYVIAYNTMGSFEYFYEHATSEEAEDFFENNEDAIINSYKNYVLDYYNVNDFLAGKTDKLDENVYIARVFISIVQRFFLSASKAWDKKEEKNVILYFEQFKKLLYHCLATGYFVVEKSEDPVTSLYVLSHVICGTINHAQTYLDGALSSKGEKAFLKLYNDVIMYADFETRRYLVNYPNDTKMVYTAIGYIATIVSFDNDESNMDLAINLYSFITPIVYVMCGMENDGDVLSYYVAVMPYFVGSIYKDVEECNTKFIELITRKYYLCFFDKEEDDSYYDIGKLIYRYMYFSDQLKDEDFISRIYNEFFEMAYGLEKKTLKMIIDFCERQENGGEDDEEIEEDED